MGEWLGTDGGEGSAMINPVRIEEMYKEFTTNLGKWAHDGIITVDLPFLQGSGLLSALQEGSQEPEDLTQYFHVVESIEKVTLFNEQFVVWIIPRMEEEKALTYVLIASSQGEKVQLEIVFVTQGVYNTPRYVLKVLQHFLIDMLDTEATLTSFEKKKP
jgi:hypothetical protein